MVMVRFSLSTTTPDFAGSAPGAGDEGRASIANPSSRHGLNRRMVLSFPCGETRSLAFADADDDGRHAREGAFQVAGGDVDAPAADDRPAVDAARRLDRGVGAEVER